MQKKKLNVKLARLFLCILILAGLLASCINKDSFYVKQPWCTILSTATIAGGIALTGGTPGAIAGGTIIGASLSMPFCYKETK